MLKILLECTKNIFASKGTWTGESERLKTRPRGESTEKGRGKQRYRTSFCLYQRNILKENKAPAFLRRRSGDCREVGVRRGRRRSSEKREEQRTVRASLRTEKAKAESFECGSALLDTTKKIPPLRRRSFCTASLQKLKKGKGSTFVFALGSSALPLAIDDSF